MFELEKKTKGKNMEKTKSTILKPKNIKKQKKGKQKRKVKKEKQKRQKWGEKNEKKRKQKQKQRNNLKNNGKILGILGLLRFPAALAGKRLSVGCEVSQEECNPPINIPVVQLVLVHVP